MLVRLGWRILQYWANFSREIVILPRCSHRTKGDYRNDRWPATGSFLDGGQGFKRL